MDSAFHVLSSTTPQRSSTLAPVDILMDEVSRGRVFTFNY